MTPGILLHLSLTGCMHVSVFQCIVVHLDAYLCVCVCACVYITVLKSCFPLLPVFMLS